MSKNIDRPGTFLGTVVESAFSVSKGGFPQWAARLLADKKYITDAAELAHFGITEPGYVDWNFDEGITAFLVLFTDKGPLKNQEQLEIAFKWEGSDFQDLATFVGKRLLFRVEERTYEGKTGFQVNWIDAEDAPPERTLQSVDPAKVAEMNKLFLASRKKPVAPAKPAVAAKASVSTPKPQFTSAPHAVIGTANPPSVVASATTMGAASAPTAASPAATAAAPTAPVVSTAVVRPPADAFDPPREKTKTAAPAKKGKTTPPPAPVTENPAPGLPAETTKDAAWEYVIDPAVRGDNTETVVVDAWQAACNEVGENVDESKFTGEMWGRVRNLILKDLGIKVS